MTTHFTELAQRAAADGQVTSQEVLALRRQGWGDGIIVREEAEALFALNNALDVRDDEWCDFFVEAIGEFVLNGTPPRLQCDDEEAEWLIAQVDHDGKLESMVKLETIVRIIERAENVPVLLKNYVLEQVEREVLKGWGQRAAAASFRPATSHPPKRRSCVASYSPAAATAPRR